MSILAINNNILAVNTANTLANHYSSLARSTQRLSSGLRINGASDDAAGLAIRELMRSDIAALRQGMRNVNDGISMLQTMDGALGVIDEKLIRMKELAEQAATGTYDSTQRMIIDSEFQAMGSEIDRIANATDFNGVKLLCTKLMTWTTNEQQFVVTDPGSVSNLAFSAANNANPVLKGIKPGNYINEANPAATITVSLTATAGIKTSAGALKETSRVPIGGGTSTTYELGDTKYSIAYVDAIGTAGKPVFEFSAAGLNPAAPADAWSIQDENQAYTGKSFSPDGTTMSATGYAPFSTVSLALNNTNGAPMDMRQLDADILSLNIDTKNGTYSITRSTVEITTTTADYTASYNADNQTVTVRLTNGGTATLKLDNPLAAGGTIDFEINLAGENKMVPVEHSGPDPNQKVKIHFGTQNDSAEDYYYINYANCTRAGLGIADVDIQTQDNAQEALVKITDAIVVKDGIRANFGAMQNRMENTLTNLSIQAENLQAAESRISDSEIAQEMMAFVRNQILTQSAVAMLAQANSMPQMVMSLIG